MIIRYGSLPSLLLLPFTSISSLVLASSSTSSPSPPSARSISLVDLLNDSPEHSLLLLALQRARLIPTVNLLNGSVLWAPTNDAIKAEIEHEKQQGAQRHRPGLSLSDDVRATNSRIWSYAVHGHSTLMSNSLKEHDNLQLQLRDTLMYHMLNYTLFPPPHDDTPPSSDNRTSLAWNSSSLFGVLPLDKVILHETLYHPSLSSFNKSFPAPPTLPGSPPDNPDPDKPHKIDGLLRGRGQRVRVVRKSAKNGSKEQVWIGGDWQGEGGAVAENKILHATNGALVSLAAVLHRPVDLGQCDSLSEGLNFSTRFPTFLLPMAPCPLAATHIRTNPDLSTFASLLPVSLLNYIGTVPHLTLFAPTNEAWASLSDLELPDRDLLPLGRKYLKSGFAEKDLIEIFGAGASREGVGKGKVGYVSSLFGNNSTNTSTAGRFPWPAPRNSAETRIDLTTSDRIVRTIWNNTLEILIDKDNRVIVNGTQVGTPDILAMNGVIHTVPRLLLPSGSLSLTAKKYLIALEATRFVSLLRSVNLSHYVQIPSGDPAVVVATSSPSTSQSVFTAPSEGEPAYTILAPPDSVLQNKWRFADEEDGDDDFTATASGETLPPAGSDALKEFLLYSIVSGKWLPEDLKDGMLVGTELRGANLRGARQRLAVNVNVASQNLASMTWGWWSSGDPNSERKPGLVGFGGVNVIREPVIVGNTVIYLISSNLEPPAHIINQAVSDLRLSTFVASVYAASLDHTLARQPAVTYLVPNNEAFTSLGLIMSYLLLPTARSELRSLVRYHAIDEIVYFEDFPRTGAARYPTLGSGAEILVRQDNGTVLVHGPTSGGLATNGEVREARVIEGNILTATGAVHIIDQVELPPTLNITSVKLMRGAKASTMLDLIRDANMSWVLEGKAPPSESSSKSGKSGDKYRTPKDKPKCSAYIILCPTDKALSRLNISYYHHNPPLLEALVRLHVIPVDPFMPLKPDGRPLVLADDASFPTLLDRSEGGESRYGSIAFRRWGDDGWLVGINGARGTGGESDSAKVVSYGRATPSFIEVDGQGQRLVAGGGVLMIDSVLLPYNSGWFRRFGWIILVAVLGTALVALIGWGVVAPRGFSCLCPLLPSLFPPLVASPPELGNPKQLPECPMDVSMAGSTGQPSTKRLGLGGVRLHEIPIRSRPKPPLWKCIHAIAFTLVFGLQLLSIHTLQLLLSPLHLFRIDKPNRSLHYRAAHFCKRLFSSALLVITSLFAPTTFVITADESVDLDQVVVLDKKGRFEKLEFDQQSLWIANHQQYCDWIFSWILFALAHLDGGIIIILKASLRWAPIVGPAMQLFEFEFIDKKHRLQDSDGIHRHAQRSTALGLPFQLLLYPEGTLVSALTRPKSEAYARSLGVPDLENLVLPRSAGLLYCMRTALSVIPTLTLYDLTIGYEGIPPKGYAQSYYTIFSWFGHRTPSPRVHLHLHRLSAAECHVGQGIEKGKSPQTIEQALTQENREAFDKWVKRRWEVKDGLMGQFYKEGKFPSEGQGSREIEVRAKGRDWLGIGLVFILFFMILHALRNGVGRLL
ncbi:BQ2448_3607 [Microbotryum intermedium]|uniref:BQ2448_3607 protein n=1 Tax=Microbotryum intermedium TaxID=269621 RepID=A0A238FCB7_9BASI|nr:BQ2448_3607 [Microbotryum intermedium]